MSFSRLLGLILHDFLKTLEENEADLTDPVKTALHKFLVAYNRLKEGYAEEQSYSYRFKCLKNRVCSSSCTRHTE